MQAYAWINIAAAAKGLNLFKIEKERIALSMTNSEITQAQKLSRLFWHAYVATD